MNISLCKIYVLFYKKGTIVKNDNIYQPLMAGNSKSTNNEYFIEDNSGNTISHKNRYYSELSGIYWVWKNTKQQIVGACHYRRFFTAKKEPLIYRFKRLFYYPAGLYKKRYGLIYTENIDFWKNRILNNDEIASLLNEYDAILPQARHFKYTVENHYKRYHDASDLVLLESILNEKYPEYLSSYHDVLQGKRLYANNMFVMKDNDFQEFMSWLFDLLFEFENRSNLEKYTGYQERILGFIAERLLTTWFKQKRLKCIELQVVYFKKLKFE